MSNQVTLKVNMRERRGKGASGRIRREGRVPAIVYGHGVEPTPVSVDSLELYHALHTEAGTNVLLRVDVEGEEHLCVARDLQKHAIRGNIQHVDLIAVDADSQISVEIPVHLVEVPVDTAGVVNQVLWTVPILVRPLDVPNYLELSAAGMQIGDVQRVEDLREQLPDGAEFDIDPERTVVTVNAPDILEEPSESSVESVAPEGEDAEDAGEVPAEGEGGDDGESSDD
jgi:large subunit ribosomal protein L25